MTRNRWRTYSSFWGSLFLLFAFASSAVGQTCVPPPADLVSWWPLDERVDSSTVADIASGYTGIAKNNPVLGVAGRVGTAASFSGGERQWLLSVPHRGGGDL